MYKCNANQPTNHHTHASHRLFTDEATVQYISMYVITYTYMYILERKTMLFQTRPQSMYCTVNSYQLLLIHVHSTITLCLLRNGDSRENDREAAAVNKHSEHSTNKFRK